jgi:hypothetical protein
MFKISANPAHRFDWEFPGAIGRVTYWRYNGAGFQPSPLSVRQ